MKYPLPALGLIFITLKLLGVIDWSWWWVTAPLWAVPILVMVTITVTVLLGSRGGKK